MSFRDPVVFTATLYYWGYWCPPWCQVLTWVLEVWTQILVLCERHLSRTEPSSLAPNKHHLSGYAFKAQPPFARCQPSQTVFQSLIHSDGTRWLSFALSHQWQDWTERKNADLRFVSTFLCLKTHAHTHVDTVQITTVAFKTASHHSEKALFCKYLFLL